MKKQRHLPRRQVADAAKAAARDGLQNVMAGLGTSRDKMSYGEYGIVAPLDRQALENMYRGSWLAKKIVNIPADDMTRAWRTPMFDDETVDDPLKSSRFQFEQAERKFQVKSKVNAALRWARLYGGSVLLLGVGDPKSWGEPLDVESIGKGDLRFIMTLDRHLCIPVGIYDYSDITSPNFGYPEYYTIAQAKAAPQIHHSRVIRLVGDELPYWASLQQARWGDSVLQVVLDTLKGRDTITAGIASMIFEANVDVLKVPDLGDLVSTEDGEAKVTKRFQLAALMKSFNRMLLLDGEDEYEKKSNSFSALDSILREFRVEVAGAADIPVSRLFGMSASGLNATGDNEVRNYYDMIAARQEKDLRPVLERLDEVLLRHTFGNVPDNYRSEFEPLWQLSDKEKADTEKVRADRDKIYFDMGALSVGAIARELKEAGTYATMTEEDVELAEELEELSQEAAANAAAGQGLGEQGQHGEGNRQGGDDDEGDDGQGA